MTYKLVLALIRAGKTEGLADKVDVYYAAGRLTDEQYADLMARLSPSEE